jgi:hypothetical protein
MLGMVGPNLRCWELSAGQNTLGGSGPAKVANSVAVHERYTCMMYDAKWGTSYSNVAPWQTNETSNFPVAHAMEICGKLRCTLQWKMSQVHDSMGMARLLTQLVQPPSQHDGSWQVRALRTE